MGLKSKPIPPDYPHLDQLQMSQLKYLLHDLCGAIINQVYTHHPYGEKLIGLLQRIFTTNSFNSEHAHTVFHNLFKCSWKKDYQKWSDDNTSRDRYVLELWDEWVDRYGVILDSYKKEKEK
jgi:hypothetical protein